MRLPRQIHEWTVFIVLAVVALILAVGMAGGARADDVRNPAWSAWFQSLSRFDADLNYNISCSAMVTRSLPMLGAALAARSWRRSSTVAAMPGHRSGGRSPFRRKWKSRSAATRQGMSSCSCGRARWSRSASLSAEG